MSQKLLKKRTFVWLATAAVAAVAVSVHFAPWTAHAQGNGRFPQDAQDLANALLRAEAARYLSGSGQNALKILGSGEATAVAGIAATPSIEASPFESSDAQVLVNNPAQDGPIATANDITSQSETAVAGIGNIVVVTFNDSSEFFTSNSFMGYSRSTNGGHTFTDLGRVPEGPISGAANLGDPGLVANRAGQFYASAIAFDPDPLRAPGFSNTISISKSTTGGLTFGNPVFIPAGGVVARGFQDKDSIAVDNSRTATDGNVYVAWTSFPPAGTTPFTLPIFFSRSTNGGASFSTPIRISSSASINQGSTITVGPAGEIYVAWLEFAPASGIVVTKSTNGGVNFGPPVFVTPVNIIGFGSGNLFGNFRVNSFPNIDVNQTNGQTYITYASMPNAFPALNPDGSDVYFVRSTNGGSAWSVPLRMNDDPSNDQFFPVLSVNRNGGIRAIWYDRRNDPNNLLIELFTTVSSDGGASFRPNLRVNVGSASFPAVGYDPETVLTYMGDYIDIKAETTVDGRGTDFLLAWGDFKRIITTPGGTRPDQDVYFTRRSGLE